MKLSFRFKQGSSTPFETIERGTAELGSARLLARQALPSRTAVAGFAFKRRAIVTRNSIHKLIYSIFHYLHILPLDGWFVWFDCRGSTFETAAVLSSCH